MAINCVWLLQLKGLCGCVGVLTYEGVTEEEVQSLITAKEEVGSLMTGKTKVEFLMNANGKLDC